MNVTKEQLDNQIALLLSQNRKIEAVKLVVDTTHCGLKNAKDYVDNFKPGNTFIAKEPPSSFLEIDGRLLQLLASGNKLEAVKLYKDTTGLGLAESKDYIDKLQERGFLHGANPLAFQKQAPVSKRRDTQIDDLVRDHGTKTKSGCFVATACYGNYDAIEVLVLRQFRDERLMQSLTGKAFVRFYYAVSPYVARQIDKSATLKKIIRQHILNPIVNRILS